MLHTEINDNPSVVITDVMMATAASAATAVYRPLWNGNSGERSTGEAVARHLEAAAELVDAVGWTRTFSLTASYQPLGPVADDASAETMLRLLLDHIRDEEIPGQPVTAVEALGRIGGSPDGDPDTRDISQEVLNLLVQALTGSTVGRFAPWAERLHRTQAEIVALFRGGARFARTYGPGAVSPQGSRVVLAVDIETLGARHEAGSQGTVEKVHAGGGLTVRMDDGRATFPGQGDVSISALA